MEPTGHPCRHVSLADPRGRDQGNLPMLLRRVANLMIATDVRSEDVMDVTFASEVTAEGAWWSPTVYWDPGEPDRTSEVEEGPAGVEQARPQPG